MSRRALFWLLLLSFPAVGWSQDAAPAPQQVDASPTVAESEAELKRLIKSRDALTQEIDRLSKITGQFQQVIVSVQMCELSLSKARNLDFNVAGVALKWPQDQGFAAALSASGLDGGDKSSSEPLHAAVIANDEALKKVAAELEKAGVLKVLAEPSLATVSGRPASMHSGGEFPITVGQRDGKTAIEFRKFGTQLEVRPVLLGQGRLRLEVRPGISELEPSLNVVVGDMTVPGLRSMWLNTAIEMNVGQTFVLSGLVQQRSTPKARKESAAAEADLTQEEIEETEVVFIVRAEVINLP